MYKRQPFGNDAALVATAREMPRGPWYRFPELGQDWIDAMAEAKAEARREAAKRCWVVAHGLANGSRGAYAAAVGCLCYEDARDASKLGNVTTAFRHSTDAKAAFEAAASLGAPATRAFALMMAGKLAWRDAARPFDDRASAAIAAFAAAVDASPAAIAKHCGREDPDVVWRLHATRLKVAALADAGRASPTALAAAAATRFAPPSSAEDSGALLSVVDDCLAAFKACRKDDPYHARAIHYHGRALLLAAKLSSAGEPASAARDAFVEAAVGDARAALDALCDRKRPQVVALWRVEGVSGCQAGLDANHRKYDRSRFKHLALYVAVLADLRDHDRLRGVAGWIASSKERSRTTRAMLHTVWNAQLRALQTDLNAPRPPPEPPASAPPAPPPAADAATAARPPSDAPPSDAADAAADAADAADAVPPPPPVAAGPPPALDERVCIEQWFATGKRTSPRTNEPLESLKLRPNHVVRRMVAKYLAERA